jgi:hypothetical protein
LRLCQTAACPGNPRNAIAIALATATRTADATRIREWLVATLAGQQPDRI